MLEEKIKEQTQATARVIGRQAGIDDVISVSPQGTIFS